LRSVSRIIGSEGCPLFYRTPCLYKKRDPILLQDPDCPTRPTDQSESTVEIQSCSCINSSGRKDRQDPQDRLYWKYIFFQTTPWISNWIPQHRSHRLDLQGLLVVAVDSELLAALIQQPASLIRIAGISCIGIFPYNSVEFSRRIHSTGCLYIRATEDLQGTLSYPH